MIFRLDCIGLGDQRIETEFPLVSQDGSSCGTIDNLCQTRIRVARAVKLIFAKGTPLPVNGIQSMQPLPVVSTYLRLNSTT